MFLRGETYDFSPLKINKFFGLSGSESALRKGDLSSLMVELSGGRVK